MVDAGYLPFREIKSRLHPRRPRNKLRQKAVPGLTMNQSSNGDLVVAIPSTRRRNVPAVASTLSSREESSKGSMRSRIKGVIFRKKIQEDSIMDDSSVSSVSQDGDGFSVTGKLKLHTLPLKMHRLYKGLGSRKSTCDSDSESSIAPTPRKRDTLATLCSPGDQHNINQIASLSATTRSAVPHRSLEKLPHYFSKHSIIIIEEKIIIPLLDNPLFKDFHPIVAGCTGKINNGEITCLRDLERILTFSVPEILKTTRRYPQFCIFSICYIQETILQLENKELTKSSDPPYSSEYFSHAVVEVMQYALSQTRKSYLVDTTDPGDKNTITKHAWWDPVVSIDGDGNAESGGDYKKSREEKNKKTIKNKHQKVTDWFHNDVFKTPAYKPPIILMDEFSEAAEEIKEKCQKISDKTHEKASNNASTTAVCEDQHESSNEFCGEAINVDVEDSGDDLDDDSSVSTLPKNPLLNQSDLLYRLGYRCSENCGSLSTPQSLTDTGESGSGSSSESRSLEIPSFSHTPSINGTTPESGQGRDQQEQGQSRLCVPSGKNSPRVEFSPLPLICWHAAYGYPCCSGKGYRSSPEVRRLLSDHSYSDKSPNSHRLRPACQRCGLLFADNPSWERHKEMLQSPLSCNILSPNDLEAANCDANEKGISAACKERIDKALKKYSSDRQPPVECTQELYKQWIDSNCTLYISKSNVSISDAQRELGKWLVVWYTLFPRKAIPPHPFMRNDAGQSTYDGIVSLSLRGIVEDSLNGLLPPLDQAHQDVIKKRIENSLNICHLQIIQQEEIAQAPKAKRRRAKTFRTRSPSQPDSTLAMPIPLSATEIALVTNRAQNDVVSVPARPTPSDYSRHTRTGLPPTSTVYSPTPRIQPVTLGGSNQATSGWEAFDQSNPTSGGAWALDTSVVATGGAEAFNHYDVTASGPEAFDPLPDTESEMDIILGESLCDYLAQEIEVQHRDEIHYMDTTLEDNILR